MWAMVKFMYSEKATKFCYVILFCKISNLLLSVCTVDKSKVEISQNFVALSEYTNFTFAVRNGKKSPNQETGLVNRDP